LVNPSRPASPSIAVQDRYIELHARLTRLTVIAAAVISMLGLVERWGHWRDVALIFGLQTAVVAYNTFVNLVLLKRIGTTGGELLRTSVNILVTIVTAHVCDWPLACWLWLPFVALAYDHVNERLANATVISFCTALDAFAIYEGVHWRYPVSFTLLAVFCSFISRVRFEELRRMLRDADEQRRALQAAHGSLTETSGRLQTEMEAREHAEIELRHAQKLEAVGRLAAGIAHEINTPVQFVGDNVQFLKQASCDLLLLIEHYRSAIEVLATDASKASVVADVNQAEADADLLYLVDNLPRAATATMEGLQRIAVIVRSMKEFAHPTQKEMVPMDVNHGILTTLTIARSEYKHVAEVETELGDLPRVTCFPGDVNQVLLNIIVNAAHAIGDVVTGTETKGRIQVRTRLDGEFVEIAISDTGGGIPDKIRSLVYDPFFTTKEVGRGTGQGLSIARQIVVDKHGGALTFDSKMGEGTTFYIRLPVEGCARSSDPTAHAA
jgi:signal transduction histidine kinase